MFCIVVVTFNLAHQEDVDLHVLLLVFSVQIDSVLCLS